MNHLKDLKRFDDLPNSAHVDVKTVAALFGCSVPTVWNRARSGELPAPRKFSAHTRWNVGELRKRLLPEAA
ncbi:helix-turn-helix transcriptional regulator [Burkholderia gladioli]|uniref:helix-turn-helix transcriptional regulator n=1 Tax=Burkholderia gladioli TaxID=28095 RepID=UPI001FC8B5D4|nr:helix-turn-helix domain-containing protein [Burkholderia gladioli]